MASSLEQQQTEFGRHFDEWLEAYLHGLGEHSSAAEILLQSQSYSLRSGGKRFRPFLAQLVFRLFSDEFQKARSVCLAVELIHTYSLIHDDLPCMDNDDFRRGRPSNHRAFSEATALLAGDGLLTDAFHLVASDETLNDRARVHILRLLGEKTGSRGMVSGQIFDMQAAPGITMPELQRIHTLKTGNLIQAAALGGALAAGAGDTELKLVEEFAAHLGLAFQIKDDLLDAGDKAQDFKSYLSLVGEPETRRLLELHSQSARNALELLAGPQWPGRTRALTELVEFNLRRTS